MSLFLIFSRSRGARSASHRLTAPLAALCALLMISGCGNKGPLYLPPDAPIIEIGQKESAIETQQKAEQTDEQDQQP